MSKFDFPIKKYFEHYSYQFSSIKLFHKQHSDVAMADYMKPYFQNCNIVIIKTTQGFIGARILHQVQTADVALMWIRA